MASFDGLKREIRVLEKLFHSEHERFRVKACGLDELCCQFIGVNSETFVVRCTIYESYPSVAPVWFTEMDEQAVVEAVEKVSEMAESQEKILLTEMTKCLLEELCRRLDCRTPEILINLDEWEDDTSTNDEKKKLHEVEEDDEFEDEDDFDDFDDNYGLEENLREEKDNFPDEMSEENFVFLEKLKLRQREEHLQGVVSGSVQASDRLMKELREVYRSESFKNGLYQVSLNGDSLYDWDRHSQGGF
ncbi:ubiquitin-conjugating enzyme E2 Q2-like [Xenia sp. Carnegie-2017]|uniref:ubiquitin-conjugating enzyme E2 Q2-like n=1 Tax=Xenia sp. Carnegie-2017 TaxID=2897299 RepID=UPI001F039580|nr:ubiquitin-conjugating enzyme E2 Q2-like [Xenia sp. Carnegie-2017]